MRTCEKCGAALRHLDGYNAALPVTQCGDCFRRTIAPVPTGKGWHVQLSPEVREKLRVEREALRNIMNANDGEDHGF